MTKEKMKNQLFLNQDKIDNVPEKVLDEYNLFVNMEKILANDLIGNVKDGQYYISNELKKALVENKKLLTKREDNYLIAKMERAGKLFKFRLNFDKFEEGTMIANFYLLEEYEGEVLETFIANYLDIDNYEFKQKAREAFNICLQEEDYADKEQDDYIEIDKIIARNKLSKSNERIFVLETYAELYIIEMMNALEKGGKVSKKVLEEYKEEVKKQGLLKVNVPHVYIKLKSIMDKVIENNGGVKEIAKENPAVKKPIERFISPVIEYDKTVATIETMVKKQEEKEDKKSKETQSVAKPAKKETSKSGGKSGGGKSGGKGCKGDSGGGKSGKKDDKKKDDSKKKLINYYLDPKEKEESTGKKLPTPPLTAKNSAKKAQTKGVSPTLKQGKEDQILTATLVNNVKKGNNYLKNTNGEKIEVKKPVNETVRQPINNSKTESKAETSIKSSETGEFDRFLDLCKEENKTEVNVVDNFLKNKTENHEFSGECEGENKEILFSSTEIMGADLLGTEIQVEIKIKEEILKKKNKIKVAERNL